MARPTDPHANDPDEIPEDHIGPVIPDPWDDPEQTDWPNGRVEFEGLG